MKRTYTKTFCNICERECLHPAYTAENYQGVSYDICGICAAAGAQLTVTSKVCSDGQTREFVRVIYSVEVES